MDTPICDFVESYAKSDSLFCLGTEWDAGDFVPEIAIKWVESEGYNFSFDALDKNMELSETWDFYLNWLHNNGVKKDPTSDCFYFNLLGPNDYDLAERLIKAGPEHAKFLRQIQVSIDITAPLFWWKEMDTYKVGTTANSTSTMHKLTSKPITIDCFESDGNESAFVQEELIPFLENLRQKYLETKDKKYWKELVRWLPESWLQTRTWTGSYANLRNIYHQRKNHKLTEWHDFNKMVEKLPYADVMICS